MNQIFTRGQRHELIPVFQHGRDADDYLLAHILAVQAVVKGDASSKWIAAATLDRYLQAIGHPQVFGTQYLDRDFLLMMEHKNDPQTLRDHNPETGMTQQPLQSEPRTRRATTGVLRSRPGTAKSKSQGC
jgi:hypothetical protein